ncbi:MAG: Ldh family oxidoreductase [Acidobacteria bacterium]|nr:Ldh family oxidoreductase [Acidobacteriota bacterium]
MIRDGVLREFVERVLRGAGLAPEAAAVTADCLVFANLRGVDSHGVQLLTFYIDHFLGGNMQVRGQGRVLSESGCCLVYDGENSVGQVVSAICADHAARLAETYGVGVVSVRRSNHFGAAAYWAQRISSRGLIGIALCNASPSVPPWQGKQGRVGTNPICMSVPGENARPWLLDMATTTVAMGKMFKARLAGESTIPAGWAMDKEGVPTTDLASALGGGLLMPLGGYKGSGLGMLVEILCGVLSGGAMSTEVGGIYLLSRPMGTCHFFLALDVARFMPLNEFRARMERLVATVKSAHPAAGFDEVLVAGDPEWRLEEERRRDGIPLDAGVWDKLQATAARLGIR